MKKALSLFLALLMLTGCCCVFAAAEEPDLTGYVKLKDPDVDTLEDGDWYFDYIKYTIYLHDDAFLNTLQHNDLVINEGHGATLPFSHISPEEQAEKIAASKEIEFWYCPETETIFVKLPYGLGADFLAPGDESYEFYGPYALQYSAPEAPTTPDTPATSDNSGSSNAAPKSQNFFQRIIEWFRNLFAKLFK